MADKITSVQGKAISKRLDAIKQKHLSGNCLLIIRRGNDVSFFGNRGRLSDEARYILDNPDCGKFIGDLPKDELWAT